MGCGGLVGVVAIAILFVWLFENPPALIAFLALIVGIVLIFMWRRGVAIDNRAREAYSMGRKVELLADRFVPLQEIALSLRPQELAFYKLDGVELREYRSGSSTYKGGYAGGNLRLTDGFSISAGGNSGKLVKDEEQATTLDVGTAIFTNQRVIFSGPKQTREWDLSKLLNVDVGDNGYEVSISSSSSQRTAALAGPMSLGITPGILFAISLETFQEGEEAGKEYARKTARSLMDAAREHLSKRGKPLVG